MLKFLPVCDNVIDFYKTLNNSINNVFIQSFIVPLARQIVPKKSCLTYEYCKKSKYFMILLSFDILGSQVYSLISNRKAISLLEK